MHFMPSRMAITVLLNLAFWFIEYNDVVSPSAGERPAFLQSDVCDAEHSKQHSERFRSGPKERLCVSVVLSMKMYSAR